MLTIGLQRVNGEFNNRRQSGILLAEYTVTGFKIYFSIIFY